MPCSPVKSNWGSKTIPDLRAALKKLGVDTTDLDLNRKAPYLVRICAHDVGVLETPEFKSRVAIMWKMDKDEVLAEVTRLKLSTDGYKYQCIGNILAFEFKGLKCIEKEPRVVYRVQDDEDDEEEEEVIREQLASHPPCYPSFYTLEPSQRHVERQRLENRQNNRVDNPLLEAATAAMATLDLHIPTIDALAIVHNMNDAPWPDEEDLGDG